MCHWQVCRGGAGGGQGGEGWSMGCQQSVEVPGRGMDDPLRCPLGTEELKKQTTTATKKGWCRTRLSMASGVQKPQWRLVFIERQRGILIFLTKGKLTSWWLWWTQYAAWYERRIFRVRCESCVISRWQSEPPASSVCVPRAYSLTLSTFATMATSSMRSCRGCFVVLRGGAALGDSMSAFCALHCTLV